MIDCGCDPNGSENNYCNFISGKCSCLPNVVGKKCVECDSGYYNHPNCQGNFHKRAKRNEVQLANGSRIGHQNHFTKLFDFLHFSRSPSPNVENEIDINYVSSWF